MNPAHNPPRIDADPKKQGTERSRYRALRVLLWIICLLTVSLSAYACISARAARTRGVQVGFPAPVPGSEVPTLGINVSLEQYTENELEDALELIAGAGFVWVRQPFYWKRIRTADGDFEWAASDRIVSAVADHPGLQLVAVLDDIPPDPPNHPERFASFARNFAARYGASIDYYQIWDEPNLSAHWGGGPVNPPAYADLLARCAAAIRAVDRSAALDGGANAHIVLAGLAPTVETGPQNLSDVRYLDQLYQAGAAPYFDVAAGKPYGFDTGPRDRRAHESVLNFSRLLLLRETMLEHGDAGKPLWASHWGWNALPANWTGSPSVWGQTDETTQAAHTAAGLDRARTEWPWTGALILENFQPPGGSDDPRWGFSLVGQDGNPRPLYDAIVEWAESLPEGGPVGGYRASNPWATYQGSWRTGPIGADAGDGTASSTSTNEEPATFRFDGSSVAMTVRRGPYRAFLYITVDGRPANGLPQDETGRSYLVLYDSTPTVTTVPLATDLAPGPHVVEVAAEGGGGQWALVDWRVGSEPVRDRTSWQLAALAVSAFAFAALLRRDLRRTNWTALSRWYLRMPETCQVALIVALSGVLWSTASATWAQILSPHAVTQQGVDFRFALCLGASLLMLPLLAALFALRLDLGLGLVAATAPFYGQPRGMIYDALSVPEALVLLCAAGTLIRSQFSTPCLPSPRNAHTACRPASEQRDVALWLFWRHPNSLDVAVILLVVAAVLSSLSAIDRRSAVFELRTIFLLPALYYVLLRKACLRYRALWRVVDGFVLGGIGVAAIGVVLYGLGHNIALAEGNVPRLTSVYSSPNSVGLYLERVWPLLVAVGLWASPSQRRTLFRLAFVPVTAALILSYSRGSLLLALPAAVLVMAWRAGRKWRRALTILVLAGALGMIPLLRLPRFASLLDLQQGSSFVRLKLWRSSLSLIDEHPLFGVGPGNFEAAYRSRFVLPSAWQEFNQGHPHNIYLDYWTRLGVLGLLAGGVMHVAFWRHNSAVSRRHSGTASLSTQQVANQALGTGLAGSVAAVLAHGFVDNTIFFPDLSLALLLTLALAHACHQQHQLAAGLAEGSSPRPDAPSVRPEERGGQQTTDKPTRGHLSPN